MSSWTQVAAVGLRDVGGVSLLKRAVPGGSTRHVPAALAGLSGCLLLAIWTSPRYSGLPPFLDGVVPGQIRGPGWWSLAAAILATLVGLGMLRWWPYLLVAAAVLTVPGVLSQSVGETFPSAVSVVASAGYPLTIVGVLACAQGLARVDIGWGAAIAGLSIGAQLFGSALTGAGWLVANPAVPAWHTGMLVVGIAGLLPAAWYVRHGDRDALGLARAGRWSWRRIRPMVAGTLAMCVAIPISLLTIERLSTLLDVSGSALYRRGYAVAAILGAVTLVAGVLVATLGGLWALAGSLTAATVRVAVVAPMILAMTALFSMEPVRLVGALAGVVIGAIAAATRWRMSLAGALAVLGAITLFIAYAATGGQPEKLAERPSAVPAVVILVLVTAAATAGVGATAVVLAPRAALPAALGPVAAVIATGGMQTISSTYLRDGLPVSSYLNPVFHLNTSAVLLLVTGTAIGGLGLAQQFAARAADRKQAEQIRRSAAAAERDRLARPIHDGVLQVLALVQRHGSELGEQGGQLATLAAEQETALRTLLSGQATTQPGASQDVRIHLRALATPAVEVATPAHPVALPAGTAEELTAAVLAALDNVRRHAGPAARAWVLLEDEGNAVRVTVRDDGVGFAPQRLAEAQDANRLGVAQSMRGRITDLGGTTTIHSSPGEGAEVEFWLPRRKPS
jgi:signal transduction histidine kinase